MRPNSRPLQRAPRVNRRAAGQPPAAQGLAKSSRSTMGALAICSILLLTGQAFAAPRSYADISVGNHYGGNSPTSSASLYLTALTYSQAAGNNISDTGPFTRNFVGLNGNGLMDTERFSGQARAQADYGVLKVESSYALSNRLANGNNVPFVNQNFSTNESGVPTGFEAYAEARVSDSVTVAAVGTVSYVQFTYRLTGDITAVGGPVNFFAGPDNYVSVYDNGGYGLYQSNTTGHIDELITLRNVPVNAGIARYDLLLTATAGLYTVFSMFTPINLDSSGSVSFFNSLQLVKVAGFSAGGVEVPLLSASGATGFNYLASTVPEPADWMLMLCGLAVLAFFVQRASSGRGRPPRQALRDR